MNNKTTEFRQKLTLGSAKEMRKRHGLGLLGTLRLLLFYTIARRLPDVPLPLAGFGQWVRVRLARKIFKKCGKNVRIHAGVRFGTGVEVELGDNSAIARDSWIANDTRIGDNVMMAPELVVLSGTHGFADITRPMIEQGAGERRPVTVGNDVWIGTRVIILPGVTVGDHAILGAGCVVTKDVPEYAIMGGSPARVLRSRLEQKDSSDK